MTRLWLIATSAIWVYALHYWGFWSWLVNWERFIVVVGLILGLIVIGLICFIWATVEGYFGPFHHYSDSESTDNPERDYDGK